MKKSTLIAAFSASPASIPAFAEALAREALATGRSAALAWGPPPKAEEPGAEAAKPKGRKAKAEGSAPADAGLPAPEPDGILRLPFRPGSALSARTLFLESANAIGQPEELLLCLEPGAAERSLLASSPEEAEAFAEERVKACFQLLREAGQRFAKLPGSAIAIALPGAPAASGFARLERDFLKALGDACMAERAGGGRFFGLSGAAGSEEEFAKALFRLLDDPRARGALKWNSAKGGLLGMF